MKHVRTAYEALVAHHQPTTNIDRIQVAMEWAKLIWDPRQETLDFIYRFLVLLHRLHEVRAGESEANQVVKLLALMPWEFRHLVDRLSKLPDDQQTVAKTKGAHEAEWKAAVWNGAECRKKSRESGRQGIKTRDTKEDHSNAAVDMFSKFESRYDQDMVNPDDEWKEDEGIQPIVVDASNTETIYLGEPGEALPLRTIPDSSATRKLVRQLSIGGIPYTLTFLSRQDLATLQIQPIQDPTYVLTLPPWL
ncbi:hypothetical protein DYB32_010097 [Aphanomyces invadans]|uniref:Uncharacterized protein n=1 Tax=Aphanomyces invadans TaxID=157072 RepID=A0A3R6ZHK4_9STRA|nr:hypothetical protein DYB32_010097 [Aphanomyces invadans]